MDGGGQWFHNDGDTKIDPSTLVDMRRSTATGWAPGSDVLNVNGTTIGCLTILPSGVLDASLDDECDESYSQACEYKCRQAM